MWLFLVEAYLFVLVAFTLGVAVGLVGVRLGVRRVAPARVAGAEKQKAPKEPSEKKRRGRRGKADAEAAGAEPGEAATSGAGSGS